MDCLDWCWLDSKTVQSEYYHGTSHSLGGLIADKVRCISTTSILSMYKADVQILPVLQLGAMSGGKVSYPSLLTFNALRRGVGVGMRGDCT